jgi:hypothetical protein
VRDLDEEDLPGELPVWSELPGEVPVWAELPGEVPVWAELPGEVPLGWVPLGAQGGGP